MYFLTTNIDKTLAREFSSVVILLFIARFLHTYLLRKCRPLRLPPGPKGWPILGALPLLGDKPHVGLAKMAKQYGPVMYLKMGTRNMAVASTPDVARAFLKTLDANFPNRPETAAKRVIRGQDIVYGDYGPRWKLLRKLSSLHMLGGKAIEDYTWVREQEVGRMVQDIYNTSARGRPMVVPEMVSFALANIVSQMVLGRRMFNPEESEASDFKDMVAEILALVGVFNVGGFISYIEWMDLQRVEGRMRKAVNKLDAMLDEMIRQHKATAKERVGKPDLLDMMVASKEVLDDQSLSATSVAKALLVDLFIAGTDTSSSVIEWALAELIKNPSILNQAREEMDQVIGRDRHLRESDLPKLPYLKAICKEALRKHPSLPLMSRLTAEACQVDGYDIPKGTRLLVNIWAIGRDPEAWKDPMEFMPERFLSNGENLEINPWGHDFELIPFGSGRRICAGMRLGVVFIEYILGTLVHAFYWNLPDEVGELNMDESFGLTLKKAIPLSIIASPRLSPVAYLMSTSMIERPDRPRKNFG